MKKFVVFMFAVSTPLAALSAQPANGTAAPAAGSTEESGASTEQGARRAPPSERRICRRIETTGSRTAGQRVCMTAEQWRRADF